MGGEPRRRTHTRAESALYKHVSAGTGAGAGAQTSKPPGSRDKKMATVITALANSRQGTAFCRSPQSADTWLSGRQRIKDGQNNLARRTKATAKPGSPAPVPSVQTGLRRREKRRAHAQLSCALDRADGAAVVGSRVPFTPLRRRP